MGFWDRFKKKRENPVWKIADKNSFIIEMNEIICRKCRNGEDMASLTEAERVFFLTQQLETEVNNGGFDQFIFNSTGDFSAETSNAFLEIGAEKTAAICQRAFSAFGQELPANTAKRRNLMEELQNDEINQILESCDQLFLNYEDDLEDLNYRYIMNHREAFS